MKTEIKTKDTKDTRDTKPHVTHNSGNNEWYTPSTYLESARELLGMINLDPASCEIANSIVQAERYFTQETNGLDKEWKGKVWLNPPYSSGLIKLFIQKLADEYQSGNVEEAILLVNNATETRWANTALEACSSACFVKGRIKFLGANLVPAKTPLQGQMILYFGERKNEFASVFSKYGVVFNSVR